MVILKENCSLRGWKNKPWCVVYEDSPAGSMPITEEMKDRLSGPFEYRRGDPVTDSLYLRGALKNCGEDAALQEHQKYFNYGCLHFDSVIFSITGRCNYNCMHCSVNAPKAPMGEIPFERICSLLDEMRECGLKNVVLIGGEPLIRGDFLRIMDEVTRRGMFVGEIFTNGSLVTPELLDALDERGLKTLFMISFDGVGWHDKMRGVPGAEEDFYRCVKLLRGRGFPVSCNMCVTRESIYSLWETIEKLSGLGVRSLTVYPPVECGLWKEKIQELGTTTELIGEEYPKVIEKYVAAGYPLDLNLYGMAFFSSTLKKYAITPKWKTWGKEPEMSPACVTFTSELNISPEGILSPCYALMSDDYIRANMPDIFHRTSLKEALTDSAFTRIMELTNADVRDYNEKCRECEFMPECGGGCRLSAFRKSGDFRGYDPQMCEFFENGFDKKFREAVRRGSQSRR